MPLSEVLPSLQRGVIDGTMSATGIFVAFKMNDAVKTITITNDTHLVSYAAVSKVWLEKLPADLQKIVRDVGREVQVGNVAWEVEFNALQGKRWEELGGTLHTLPSEDLKKMAELLASVGDDVSKDQPEVIDMLKRMRAVTARH